MSAAVTARGDFCWVLVVKTREVIFGEIVRTQQPEPYNPCSAWFCLWHATGCQLGNQRCAKLGRTATTIFQEKQGQLFQTLQICPVNDRAAVSLPPHQPGPRQGGEMGRHGILRHRQKTRQLTGRNAFRLMPDKKTKCIQPGGLGQGAKRRDC